MAAGTERSGVRILHATVQVGHQPDFAAIADRVMSPTKVGLWAGEDREEPKAFVDEVDKMSPPWPATVTAGSGVRVNHAAECRSLTPRQPGWQSSGAFVVLGIWQVRAGSGGQFAPVAVRNAEASVRDEPGCVFFHVLADLADPDRFYLLEGFRSSEDFTAHSATAHFAAFAEVARPLFAGDRSLTIQGAIHLPSTGR
jgi:quinol monooxygenase YgiN